MEMFVLLIVLLLILMMTNLPVWIAIGLSTTTLVVFTQNVDLMRLPQAMFSSLNSFPLMALPFFIVSGKLMEYTGISQKIIDFAKNIVGDVRGGLAMVTVLACMFFAAISGSSYATIAAIGAVMIPSMVEQGYDRNFATALHAASGTIGGIIPPSIPYVVFGVTAGVSIGKLFLAGIIPGVLIGISFMVISYFLSPKNVKTNIQKFKNNMKLKNLLISLKDSIWALLMPVIILGGIYGGWFTPTEAAAISILYALIVGFFVYKTLTLSIIIKTLESSVVTTASIAIIIAAATFFSTYLSLERIPHMIAMAFQSLIASPIIIMMLINIFLLFLGMFMDASAATIITTPILMPIVTSIGYDPVHFGIIMSVNLSIGLITPPFGMGLYVAAPIGKTRFELLLKPVLPYIIMMIVDLILIILLPQITVGFANLFM